MNDSDGMVRQTNESPQEDDQDDDVFLNHEELLAATLAELLDKREQDSSESKPPDWLVKGYGNT